jgi:hypothetical protein
MDEERYIKGPRINHKALKRKAEAKQKRLDKARGRIDRAPSCRIGKNEKKFIARRKIILEENEPVEQPVTAEPLVVKFGRPKRKVSRRLDKATDHLEDDPHWSSNYMAELSLECHRKETIEENEIRRCYAYVMSIYARDNIFWD